MRGLDGLPQLGLGNSCLCLRFTTEGVRWLPQTSWEIAWSSRFVKPLSGHLSRLGDRVQRHGDIGRVEKPVELGTAGSQLDRLGGLGLLLPGHLLLQLLSEDSLDGSPFDLIAQTLCIEEFVER